MSLATDMIARDILINPIMKLIDKFNSLLNKVGVDKVLHRLVGDKVTLVALLTAYMISNGAVDTMINTDIAVGGLLMLISIIKEQIDSKADYMDVVWAMGGWLIVSTYFWIVFLIF